MREGAIEREREKKRVAVAMVGDKRDYSLQVRKKMTEKERKKMDCNNCNTTNCTKYDCQTCTAELCSTCTEIKPAEYKVLLNYVGQWDCEHCRREEKEKQELNSSETRCN
jgi:hypothetical protein